MQSSNEGALKRAIEMEEEGKGFYLRSAKEVKSELARKVFEQLAREEDSHIVAIKRIHASLEGTKPFKEWVTTTGTDPGALEKVFREALVEGARASETDVAAMRFALDLEDKSVKYYETLANTAESPFEKRFFLTLSYEERGHYLRILDSIEYLADPAGWFYVHERDMVDGG
jgi:rubrerythrin